MVSSIDDAFYAVDSSIYSNQAYKFHANSIQCSIEMQKENGQFQCKTLHFDEKWPAAGMVLLVSLAQIDFNEQDTKFISPKCALQFIEWTESTIVENHNN